MGLFPPSRQSVKKRVAERYGGALVNTREGHTVVVNTTSCWSVIFDNDSFDGPSIPLLGARPATRIGIPFVSRDGFTWELKRRGLIGAAIYKERRRLAGDPEKTWEEHFEKVRPQLTTPDLLLGYGDFDYEFSIETNDPGKMRLLLAEPALRRHIQEQPTIFLAVALGEEWLTAIAEELSSDIGVLYIQRSELVKEDEHIQQLYGLLTRTIERMAATGSAAPVSPDFLGASGRLQIEAPDR